MKRKILMLPGLLLALFVTAQPNREWSKTYGGILAEDRVRVQPTPDGGSIVLCHSISEDGQVGFNRGNEDLWVFKTDQSGELIWSKTYGGTSREFARDIELAADGGYFISGSSSSNDFDVSGRHGTTYDAWVLKISSTGTLEWQKMFGGTQADYGRRMVKTPDGGVVMVGYSNSADGDLPGSVGDFDAFAVKFSASGAVVWKKRYGGTQYDLLNDIAPAPDGGFFMVGSTYSTSVPGYHASSDSWVIKTDNEGNLEWQKAFGGTRDDFSNAVIQTAAGDFIVVGGSGSYDGDNTNISIENLYSDECWVFRIDSDGNLIWTKSIGTIADDLAEDIVETIDGDLIMGSRLDNFTGNPLEDRFIGRYDVMIYGLDLDGQVLWEKVTGGFDNEFCHAIVPAADGGFLAAMTTYSTSVDIESNHGDYDVWLQKFGSTVGAHEVPKSEVTITPNPAVDQISLKLPHHEDPATVAVTDAAGSLLLTGAGKTSLNISGLTPGTYWITAVTSNGIVYTGRFVKSN